MILPTLLPRAPLGHIPASPTDGLRRTTSRSRGVSPSGSAPSSIHFSPRALRGKIDRLTESYRARGIFYAARWLQGKRGRVKIEKLDHIALYMSDRDAAADFLTSYIGFHVVDHTDRYTLVGAGGRIGKLTLFDASEGTTPSPGPIERINVRVADPEQIGRASCRE